MKLADLNIQEVASWLNTEIREDFLLGGMTPGIPVAFGKPGLTQPPLYPLGQTVKASIEVMISDLHMYHDLDTFLRRRTLWETVLTETGNTILGDCRIEAPDTTVAGSMNLLTGVDTLLNQARPVGSLLLNPVLAASSLHMPEGLAASLPRGPCLAVGNEVLAVHTNNHDTEYLVENCSDVVRQVDRLEVVLALQVFRRGNGRPTVSRIVW